MENEAKQTQPGAPRPAGQGKTGGFLPCPAAPKSPLSCPAAPKGPLPGPDSPPGGPAGGFLDQVLRIALPVGLQSMLQSSFTMVDQLMVGQLGGCAVAAVEAAGRPIFICTTIMGAVAAVAGIMAAQYLGMRRQQLADRSFSANLAAAGAITGLFTLLCLCAPGRIVGLFTPDAAIRQAGRGYLVRAAWTMPAMGFGSLLAVMLRCMGRASWALWAGLFTAAANTGLNLLLIFGRLGFPALGVAGAADASVLAQWAGLWLLAALFGRLRAGGPGRFAFCPSLGPGGGRQYLRMLLPAVLCELLWSLGQSLNTFIYGRLAPGSLAAMAITGPVQGLFMGALGGVSQAAGILIGRRLGAGQAGLAYREAKRLGWYGLAGSLGLSALVWGLRGGYVRLYRVEPGVQDTAAALLAVFALLAPAKVANMVLGGGVLRSGGNTRLVLAVDFIGTWLVGAPLGLAAAFWLRLPIVWVYCILSQEELVRLAVTLWLFKRKSWMARLPNDVPSPG